MAIKMMMSKMSIKQTQDDLRRKTTPQTLKNTKNLGNILSIKNLL